MKRCGLRSTDLMDVANELVLTTGSRGVGSPLILPVVECLVDSATCDSRATRECESTTAVGGGDFFQILQIRQRCQEYRHLYTVRSHAPLLAAHFEIPLRPDKMALHVFISSWRPPVNARSALYPSCWLNNAYKVPIVPDQLLYRVGNLAC